MVTPRQRPSAPTGVADGLLDALAEKKVDVSKLIVEAVNVYAELLGKPAPSAADKRRAAIASKALSSVTVIGRTWPEILQAGAHKARRSGPANEPNGFTGMQPPRAPKPADYD